MKARAGWMVSRDAVMRESFVVGTTVYNLSKLADMAMDRRMEGSVE